ncbi:secreted protein [Rhizoctonia solani 123E]|uniref:Secreted protein n=1 Tax=Rhizoctonia solani 123E TaxID=1423351 RepID=A0A074RZE5_9AGAM|nr:secreted protein [Rhizoctonia solani 123E]
MHLYYLLASASIVIASKLGFNGGIERRALPTPADVATVKQYLAELIVAEPVNEPPYKRAEFPHWISTGGKCDTREIVLYRDGQNVTRDSECRAVSGNWFSEYDAKTWNDSQRIDIDHIIPLKEGWGAGAWNWTRERRKMFANDLVRPQLIAVTDTVNQAKGDKDPALWMPPLPSYHCTYIRAWIEVKHFYELSVNLAEKTALTTHLSKCEAIFHASDQLVLGNFM